MSSLYKVKKSDPHNCFAAAYECSLREEVLASCIMLTVSPALPQVSRFEDRYPQPKFDILASSSGCSVWPSSNFLAKLWRVWRLKSVSG